MEKVVIFSDAIEDYLNELVFILFEKEYFAFQESAKSYVTRIVHYAEQYIDILHGRNAPPYFRRYGSDLKYITYRANKHTSWYIFYRQQANIFLVCHITNNHVAAQYFNS